MKSLACLAGGDRDQDGYPGPPTRVGWERVFAHGDPPRSSEIHLRSPPHCLADHEAAVWSWCKVRLLVGVASRIARGAGTIDIPAVRELLGRLAALEATIAGLVRGPGRRVRDMAGGVAPNRRYVYASLQCADARAEVELFRLAWDLIGSDFAGRQQTVRAVLRRAALRGSRPQLPRGAVGRPGGRRGPPDRVERTA